MYTVYTYGQFPKLSGVLPGVEQNYENDGQNAN